MIAPELAEGGTFYDMTISARDFRYARKAEVRAAILRELKRWRFLAGLATTAQRVAVADAAMADDAFLYRCTGMVITAVARDVVDAWLGGRWD